MQHKIYQYLLVLSCICFSIDSFALIATGSCGDNATFTLDDNGIMTISGTGEIKMIEYYLDETLGVVINEGITGIGVDAFFNFKNMKSLQIPNSVTSIGNSAFQGCRSLTSVTIPNGVESIGDAPFLGCTSLIEILVNEANTYYKSQGGVLFNKGMTELIQYPGGKTGSYTIPNGVEAIRSYAFESCYNISSVIIPNSVTRIETEAFACTSLTSITIPNSVIEMGDYVFRSSVNLPVIDNIRYADTYLVEVVDRKCSDINIKDGTKWIGENAFAMCANLLNISIPNTVVSIKTGAFHDSGILEVLVPNSVSEIESQAFYNCSKLSTIKLPDGEVVIGEYVFSGCTSLPCYEWIRYADTYLVKAPYDDITSAKIKEGTRWIGEGAFYGCSYLETITIPSKVEKIGVNAFVGCRGLREILVDNANLYYTSQDGVLFNKEITELLSFPGSRNGEYSIPNGVESIMPSAFCGCYITDVTIPSTVTTIGGMAFYDCQFDNITNLSLVPQTLYGNEFSNINCMLHVPAKSYSAYKQANIWKKFNIAPICVYYGSCGEGVTWILDEDGVLSFIGTGEVCNDEWYGLCADKVKKVVVGADISSIKKGTFELLDNLTYIEVDNANKKYSSQDGVLFNKSMTELIQYPGGKSGDYAIPNGVKVIADNAFEYCKQLSSIECPSSVETIGVCAFARCFNLVSVTIGEGVKTIGEGAFVGSTKLEKVTNLSPTPQTIGEDTFSVYGILYVQDNSLSAYQQSAYWKNFTIKPLLIGSGKCGYNAYWELEKDGSLTISGSGEMTSTPWISYSDQIKNVVVEEEITNIADAAFSFCESLSSVSLPSTLKSIGSGAFSDCYSLTNISIPTNVDKIGDEAFGNCSVLSSITVPNGVASIGKNTFISCYELAYIALPNTLTSIGESAFQGCKKLETITLPNSLRTISKWAFKSCTGLTSIEIPSSVTEIGVGAFANCNNLQTINVASANSSFSSQDGVLFNKSKTVLIESPGGKNGAYSIPEGVTSIGDGAFMSCIGLTSVVIPNSVNNIGASAFRDCSKLDEVTNNAVVPQVISEGTFNHYGILNVASTSLKVYQQADYWKNFTIIPMPIGSCGDNASWTLSNGGVLTISGSGEVSGNPWGTYSDQIKEVIVNDGVTSIGQGFFSGCSNLVLVTIPNTVSKIGDGLFSVCNSLATIIWNPSVALSTSMLNGFSNPNLLLYVKVKSYAPSSVKNVVVNGVAENIVLSDADGNNNFYVPQAFTATHIAYTHNYSQNTIIGTCAGWETIALPFDVQNISHSGNGEIAPFAANNSTAKPFWLYSLGNYGFTAASEIKANTPYIISMPNNQEYSDEYILGGEVAFSAENVTVPVTTDNTSIKGELQFVPTMLKKNQDASVYAINKGSVYDGQQPGSVFVSGLRAVSPFEAYLTLSGSMAKAAVVNLFDLGFDVDATGINIPKKEAEMRMWCSDGTLHIRSDRARTIRIYSVGGAMVRTVNLTEGENTISLPAGAYIIDSRKMVIY